MHLLDFSIPGQVFLPLDATTNAFKAILGTLRFVDECRDSTRGKVVAIAPAVMAFLREAGGAAAQHGHTAWRDSHFPPSPAEAARAALQSVHAPAPAAFAGPPALTQQQRDRIAFNRERALEKRRRATEDAVAVAAPPAPVVAPVAVVPASAAITRRRSDAGRRQRSQRSANRKMQRVKDDAAAAVAPTALAAAQAIADRCTVDVSRAVKGVIQDQHHRVCMMSKRCVIDKRRAVGAAVAGAKADIRIMSQTQRDKDFARRQRVMTTAGVGDSHRAAQAAQFGRERSQVERTKERKRLRTESRHDVGENLRKAKRR